MIAQSSVCIFLKMNTEVFNKDGDFACTRINRRFCIPKSLAASASSVSTQNVCTSCCAQSAVPLGFCCGGFSSTAGYGPGNEAQSFPAMSGIASFWRFLSKRRCSFLSEQLEKVLRLFSASLSASTQGVHNNYFPHFVALKQCVTASVCLSLCRSNARKQI